MKSTKFVPVLLLFGCSSDEPVQAVSYDTFYNNSGIDSANGTGSGSVPSALNPFATGHLCNAPVLSGSIEQKACFEEAQNKCPDNYSPSQVEFEQQPDGQFLIKGYACA